MSCKIFISHSTTDKVYANFLTDFLTNGLGISDSDIFCSSTAGSDIPIGVDFNDYILKKIKESSGFYTIAIISNSYYNSRYCIYELGAAWGIGKNNDNIIPFLVEDMDRGNPKDFIRYKQNVIGQNISDINKLVDKVKSVTGIKRKNVPTEKFDKERQLLVKSVQSENELRLEAIKNVKITKNKTRKIKLVAFDFDGTILHGNNYTHSWRSIWKFLNYDDSIRKTLFSKHYQNPKDFNFQEWCNECVKYFKEKGFKRKYIREIIKLYNLKIATNFEEVVKVLTAFGIKVIIISGGIDSFIHETLDEDFRDEFIDEIFINKFIYDEEGNLESVKAVQSTESDTAGKVKLLENYCALNKISLSEVAFVGDRMNDIDILQVVGVPIVYPALKADTRLRSKEFNFSFVHEDSLVHILPSILE